MTARMPRIRNMERMRPSHLPQDPIPARYPGMQGLKKGGPVKPKGKKK